MDHHYFLLPECDSVCRDLDHLYCDQVDPTKVERVLVRGVRGVDRPIDGGVRGDQPADHRLRHVQPVLHAHLHE